MGDMADYLIEQGMDALAQHEAGGCDGPCQECDAEEKEQKARLRARAKRMRARAKRRKAQKST